MAVAPDAIWAVDLGNTSLKALHLVAVGDVVQVIGFDHIPHNKILSSSGISAAERDELIAITLRQFVQRNDVSYDPLIVSVPSQNSFARFVTLPPVEQKKLPEIVKFEAAQQIPFDMSEVQWDYVMMTDPDAAEQKVGIFAIKNEIVEAAIEHFEREELPVNYVQMTPMALYNSLLHDRPELVRSDSQATVIVNVGADSTDLVVCTESGVWQRCIMMGGNTFTQAIAETFKLSFEKAEKLKRTAPMSKYARQIFQAMRPVFTDWAGEVQRSLGFYTNSNPNVKLKRVVAMGGGTRLRGLLKYLQQTLQIPVEKPEAFKRLALAQGLSTAKFHENVADFGVVYGLGLQGLGMARIESNLLPKSVARSMAWASKNKYFIGAAVLLLVTSLLCFARVGIDKVALARNEDVRASNERITSRVQRQVMRIQDRETAEETVHSQVKKYFEQFKYREVFPELYTLMRSAMPNAENNPDQAQLYEAYARGDAETVKQIPRDQRKQVFLTSVSIFFSDDLENAQFGQTALKRSDAMREAGMEGMDSAYGDMGMGMYDMYAPGGMPGMTEPEKDAGFVISIVGYSPYKDIEALLYPPNVESDPDRWGFMTRMSNLDIFVDPNCPLQLYSTEAEQLRFTTDVVDYDTAPLGVGELETIPEEDAAGDRRGTRITALQGEEILVDPVTGERISAKPKRNDRGTTQRNAAAGKNYEQEYDHWFELSFKLTWDLATEIPSGITDTRRR